jgi:Ser/Thr protein kinase RdoA (MazF antagonist)
VRPTDSELRAGLERAVSNSIVGLVRRASRYRTSFPLEELDVTLEGGETLSLVCKRLGWRELAEEARLAKPEFLHDPRREPAVYAEVLAPHRLGPRCYGSAIDARRERYWLFLERVAGRELYQVGDLTLWRATAAWLAEMHAKLAEDLERHAARGRLLLYDESYYRRWIVRAREFAAAAGDRERSRALDWIGRCYDAVVAGLLELPRTVLHGELYASNVLVSGEPTAPRVCPVDWETAAVGPGAVDLAALVSGGWNEEERQAIVAAYRATAGNRTLVPEQLALARLHLAVQWLGWAPPEWVPPEGQRHDWLGEALVLADELDL